MKEERRDKENKSIHKLKVKVLILSGIPPKLNVSYK